MSKYDFNPTQVIDALGGTNAVARLCEIAPASVSDWKKKGIPKARLMYLKLAVPKVFRDLAKQSKAA